MYVNKLDNDELDRLKQYPIIAGVDSNMGNLAHICANIAPFDWLKDTCEPPQAKRNLRKSDVHCKNVGSTGKRIRIQKKQRYLWLRYTRSQRRFEQHSKRFQHEIDSAKKAFFPGCKKAPDSTALFNEATSVKELETQMSSFSLKTVSFFS